MRKVLLGVVVLAFVVSSACGNPAAIPAAQLINADTVVAISAASGTPLDDPSGFSIAARGTVRTDLTLNFDFVFDIDPNGRAVFLPLGVLGLAKTQVLPPGFIRDSSTYDNITLAPLNGYVTSDTVVVEVGARYIARSRVVCTVPNVPEYAKLEILSVDTLARVVTFKILADNNCGYRGLAPGVPTG